MTPDLVFVDPLTLFLLTPDQGKKSTKYIIHLQTVSDPSIAKRSSFWREQIQRPCFGDKKKHPEKWSRIPPTWLSRILPLGFCQRICSFHTQFEGWKTCQLLVSQLLTNKNATTAVYFSQTCLRPLFFTTTPIFEKKTNGLQNLLKAKLKNHFPEPSV